MDDDPDYNSVIQLPPAIPGAAVYIRGVLADFARLGCPLWPFVLSTLHVTVAFLANETGSARIAVLTWDASLHGWGPLLRGWDNKTGKVVIGSLPDLDDMQHQDLHDTLSCVLSLEAAAREIDLDDATIILHNNVVCALAALRRGSFSSTFIQICAMRSCHLH